MFNISLLGYPEFYRGNEKISITRKKTIALIAYLADTDRWVSRIELSRLLWPESSSSRGLAVLRTVLADLSNHFSSDILLKKDDLLRLNDGIINCDCREFRFLEEGDMDSDIQKRVVALWRGGFLLGFDIGGCPGFYDWQLLEEQRYNKGYRAITGSLCRTLYSAEKYSEALLYWKKLLLSDPFDEEVLRGVMSCYYSLGDTSAALAQYEQCQVMIQKEFDFPPEDETLVLVERIRIGKSLPQSLSYSNTSSASLSKRVGVLGFHIAMKLQIEFPDLNDILCQSMSDVLSSHGVDVISPAVTFGRDIGPNEFAKTALELKADFLIAGDIVENSGEIRIEVRLYNTSREWVQQEEVLMIGKSEELILAGGISFGSMFVKEITKDDISLDQKKKNNGTLELFKMRAKNLLLRYVPSELEQAIELLSKCVDTDPDDAEAWGLLGHAYLQKCAGGIHGQDTKTLYSEAMKAVNRAVFLDSEEPTALMVFGQILEERDRNYCESEKYLMRSYKKNSRNSVLLIALSQNLQTQGRFQESLEMANRALELDPMNHWAYSTKHWCLIAMKRCRALKDVIDEIQSLFPDNVTREASLGIMYMILEDWDKALDCFTKVRDELISSGRGTLVGLQAHVYASQGEEEKAEEVIAELSKGLVSFAGYHMPFASTYAAMGKIDESLDWLERAEKAKDPGLQFLVITPFYEPLYDHPRYQALLDRTNLPNRKNLNY